MTDATSRMAPLYVDVDPEGLLEDWHAFTHIFSAIDIHNSVSRQTVVVGFRKWFEIDATGRAVIVELFPKMGVGTPWAWEVSLTHGGGDHRITSERDGDAESVAEAVKEAEAFATSLSDEYAAGLRHVPLSDA